MVGLQEQVQLQRDILVNMWIYKTVVRIYKCTGKKLA